VLAFLLANFALYLWFAAGAIAFPFGIDYAEGEVWWQANFIPGPAMYGDINTYPYIGFEYPPLYYLLANGVAWFGGGFLRAGRLVSCVATLASAALIARIVYQAAAAEGSKATARIAASVAGLTAFTLVPVFVFSILAHVDLLGLMFSLMGISLAMTALRRPRFLYAAVLACVAAVFVKQNLLAAPLTILAIFAWRDPWRTVRAYGLGFVIGAIVTVWLALQTHGGFLRHLFLYPMNRWSAHHWLDLAGLVWSQGRILIMLAAVSVALRWRAMVAGQTPLTPLTPGQAAAPRGDSQTCLRLLAIYLVLSAGLSVLAGKVGASVNYFVETLYACCIWLGLLVALHVRTAAAGSQHGAWRQRGIALSLPLLFVLQFWSIPFTLAASRTLYYGKTVRRDDAALLAAVRAIGKPVISDDLALVLLAGKQPAVEPFLFAQLESQGLWNDAQLISLMDRHAIGAVVTYKDPGDPTFDDRFKAGILSAVLRDYPRVEKFGDARLRLPAAP
jgi:hypothetical protein